MGDMLLTDISSQGRISIAAGLHHTVPPGIRGESTYKSLPSYKSLGYICILVSLLILASTLHLDHTAMAAALMPRPKQAHSLLALHTDWLACMHDYCSSMDSLTPKGRHGEYKGDLPDLSSLKMTQTSIK